MSAKEQHLAGEYALTDIGQMVLAVAFFATWGLDSFLFRWTVMLNARVSLFVRLPIAALLLAIGAYMASSSHRLIFGQSDEKPRVVRTGVFGVARHPMYLSEIMIYLGLLLLSMSLLGGAIWLLTIGFLHFIAGKEEQLLLAYFGDEYRDYRRTVPMWLPRLIRRYTPPESSLK